MTTVLALSGEVLSKYKPKSQGKTKILNNAKKEVSKIE
tara:strand:+ start:491 stop:604 length:114 start_codon:yes stop_codon:yes gene_type:complete